MQRKLIIGCLLIILLIISGCSLADTIGGETAKSSPDQPVEQTPKSGFTIRLSRDFGQVALDERQVELRPDNGLLQYMEAEHQITTGYGGGFIVGINGLVSAQSEGRNSDWFFFVNGDVYKRQGIEHKLGLHGNPTCVMNYGENDDCIGFLVGDPPGEDGIAQGMAQMFNMMNEERLMTGLSAAALAAVAYHNAADYARQRIQGKPTSNPKGEQVAIINHEDVRRSLMMQKAYIDAFRAMAIGTFYLVDIKNNSTCLLYTSRCV